MTEDQWVQLVFGLILVWLITLVAWLRAASARSHHRGRALELERWLHQANHDRMLAQNQLRQERELQADLAAVRKAVSDRQLKAQP